MNALVCTSATFPLCVLPSINRILVHICHADILSAHLVCLCLSRPLHDFSLHKANRLMSCIPFFSQMGSACLPSCHLHSTTNETNCRSPSPKFANLLETPPSSSSSSSSSSVEQLSLRQSVSQLAPWRGKSRRGRDPYSVH